MRDRYFGVEIEHGNYSHGYDSVAALLCTKFPELWERGYKGLTISVGSDGSGIEVRTPPLIGSEGFRTLRSLFSYLKEIGGYTAGADGMHVHFDAPEFVAEPELVVILAKNWAANENALLPFVAERRHSRGSCPRDLSGFYSGGQYTPTWTALEAAAATGSVQEVAAQQRMRGALNISGLGSKGTIEVRLHEGTLEYGQAAAWIRFCIAFINASAEGKLIRSCNTPVELLNEVKPHVTAKRQLSRRAVGELVYA